MNIPWDRFVDLRDDAIQAIVLLLIIAIIGYVIKRMSRVEDKIDNLRDNHMHDLQNAIEGVKADLRTDISAVAARVQSLDEFLRGQR